MHCSHVITERPWFKVSHVRVLSFWGRVLCQMLSITCVTMDFYRFNL
jgi:hypothetical protein